jgi:hypothetical protein
MRPTDILEKSVKGLDEIRTRKYKLAGKARMLLLLIDGRLPAFMLREQGAKMGLPADTLDLLYDQGFVEARSAAAAAEAAAGEPIAEGEAGEERFAHYTNSRRLMTESVFSALGLKGFLFTLKIEKTGNLDDLRQLIPDYQRLLTKAIGEESAQLFVARLRELMGDQPA